ncbi:MAG: DUF4147 domain-containing protein [Kofleriaceae bacterium]|nr:DUF4147 domain-containing protein [Kofleriaceae bacterium]
MDLRARLASVFADAIAACDPAAAVRSALAGRALVGPVTAIAIGKAAPAMAAGAAAALGPALVDALVIHPDGAAVPAALARFDVRAAAHPVPDARSEAAGRAALAIAAGVTADATLLVLISGGASALAAVPTPGLTLAAKVAAVQAVARGGAPIAALNAARAARSAIKGGRLAAACPGRVLTLVVSDVPGDDVAVVGSGPTVPARPGDEVVLVSGLASLRRAAARAAGPTAALDDRDLCGDVAEVAAALRDAAARLAPGGTWIGGGEWTVRLAGRVGRGGRASELALRCARWLAGGDAVVLVGASDGVDGTGPDAGAIVDGSSWARAEARGLDPAAALAAHDSGAVLAAIGDAITTGPTGINHADLVVIARPAAVVREGP